MDLVSMYQGYIKCAFGSENSSSSLDSCIKRLLDRISYGVLAEDRGNAMLNFNLLYQKVMLHNWHLEQWDLLSQNTTLAVDLVSTGGSSSSELKHRPNAGAERVQVETVRRDLQEASQQLEMLKTEKTKIGSDASVYQDLAGKMEADLKSLSDAYDSLAQTNKEVKALRSGGSIPIRDVDTLKSEAREEAQKESEAE